MNTHDDYMDVRSAFRAYDKAYEAWGRAVDGKVLNRKEPVRLWRFTPPASEPTQKRMATRLAKAAARLADAANEVRAGLRRRGWEVPS